MTTKLHEFCIPGQPNIGLFLVADMEKKNAIPDMKGKIGIEQVSLVPTGRNYNEAYKFRNQKPVNVNSLSTV
jgi:hypothetical protein